MTTAIFKITGLDCIEEVKLLKSELGKRPGVQELAFDVLNAKMTVIYSEAAISDQDLIAAVALTGMKAEPWCERRQSAEAKGWQKWARPLTTTTSGILIAAAFLTDAILRGPHAAFLGHDEEAIPLAAYLLYLSAVIAGAWFVAPKAWRALKQMRPDMNLLMTVAVIGALGIGEYFEAATVAFLFALSLTLEAWSVGRARRAIAALMALTPDTARLLSADGTEQLIEAEHVPVGATIIVRPGERFPLDGKISKGQTTANQAPITGESFPVRKSAGDEVFAGTINEDGAVEILTTKPAQDTKLAHIVKLVGDAQSKRSPSEQWVEKFAHYYTPIVMCLAIAVMILPPLLWGAALSHWFYQGLLLLVIACPCALVISTPVSIVAALATAARNGVLVKGGPYIELPAHLKAVALDKTGTLTQGHPQVLRLIPLSGHNERELLEIAAAVESRSEHPLARAIEHYAESQGVSASPAQDFQAVKGKGATARLGDREVWVGSHRYLEERGQETAELHEQLNAWADEGTSTVVIGENHHVCGLIAVGDAIRPNARAAVSELKAAGILQVTMLTGDNKATGEAVGHAAGVDEVRAELLPEDKVQAVQELVAKYGQVAMVGDGVNDAPAMACATLGIAMGAIGTDVALETADIALMSDDLSKLGWLIHHSRRTLTIIRQNIAASLLVKSVFVLLTLAGHASLWAAIVADMGISLLVVLNALRLLTGVQVAPDRAELPVNSQPV